MAMQPNLTDHRPSPYLRRSDTLNATEVVKPQVGALQSLQQTPCCDPVSWTRMPTSNPKRGKPLVLLFDTALRGLDGIAT